MEKQLKLIIMKVRKFWDSLSKRLKVIMVVGLAAVLVLSIAIPVMLNRANQPKDSDFIVLYPKITSEESYTVYTELKNANLDVKMNEKGETLVKKDQIEIARITLASLGLPKTALSYDTFTSNSGFMTTELEKKTALLYQLQDSIAATLTHIEGVESAIVLLSVPEDNSYVWSSTVEMSKASVTLGLARNTTLVPKQVQAIKYLVANSVPNLEYDNVSVIDASTSVILNDVEITNELDTSSLQLDFQRSVEKNMEDKIKTLLSLPYGAENIAVSATVTIDFDKMVQEELTYYPEMDGHGVLEYIENYYSKTTDDTTEGIVGEDSNTDIPIYPTIDKDDESLTEAKNVAKYLVSSIKNQIEKNQWTLSSGSVAVVIHGTEDLTFETLETLTNTIAKAVNLDVNNVIVSSFPETNVDVPTIVEPEVKPDYTFLIIPGIVVLLIVIIIIAVLVIRNRIRENKIKAQLAAEQAEKDALAAEKRRIEEEKNRKMEEAQDESNKMKTTIETIKTFTADNPQIAASLIKEWLREGEGNNG